jgi:hypothetical protein
MTWTQSDDPSAIQIDRELIEDFLVSGFGSFRAWIEMPGQLRAKIAEVARDREIRVEATRIAALAYAIGGDTARERAMQVYAVVDGGAAAQHCQLERRAQETAARLHKGEVVL